MIRLKKYAIVLVAGVAIGLLWAQAVLAQPSPGDRPRPDAEAAFDADDPPHAPPGPPPNAPPGAPMMQGGSPNPGAPGGMPPPSGRNGQAPGPMSGPLRPGMLGVSPGPGAGFGGGPRPPGMGGVPGMPFGSGIMMTPDMADPEMFKLQREDMELEQQSRELAMQYQQSKAAPKEDREKIKKAVVDVVNKQFEVRQQRRALELKRMEEQLKRLREIVERRAKVRKDLVDKRVSELIGPEEPGVEF